MKFIEAIKFGFMNYFKFQGVVDRTTFWFWMLFVTILGWLDVQLLGGSMLTLAVLIPTFALVVRRYRDAGVSPRWLLLWLIPIFAAGPIMLVAAAGIGPNAPTFSDIIASPLATLFLVFVVLVLAPVPIINIFFLTKRSKK